MDSLPDAAKAIFAYHERTKHQPYRPARGPGYLDWDSQPDPFRTYTGAPQVDLALAADELETRYCDLFQPGKVSPRPLDPRSLATFFELALGLTAWKEYEGSRWALRSDPSSGNLHPTEGYALLPTLTGIEAGVYHYVSRDHQLERRCRFASEPGALLPSGGFLFGLASIHWRESWKYGERAFRYCQHDAGHVIATARFAAAALGWSARLLDGIGDARIASLLGLDREDDLRVIDEDDREHPEAILYVGPDANSAASIESSLDELLALAANGTWSGKPNVLSPDHVSWDTIEAAQVATSKVASVSSFPEAACESPRNSLCETRAATIIRQRRSAVALDGKTPITAEQFFTMLDALVPRDEVAPWDALPWKPRIHLGIFVHRVEGLESGLYLLERGESVHDEFRTMIGDEAKWTTPPGCPEHLRLFCIGELDCRGTAASLSCTQAIAGDGAFSLGMLAEYRDTLEADPANYRRLFWEAGMLGQVLYLEAEAAGVRGTGIGCYFDDAFHRVMGLEGDRFQSLYHFTVGTAVEDTRLGTLPAYAHLGERRP